LQYDKQGQILKMSYYRAPEELFDDPDIALVWANLACDAALKAQNK